MREEIEKWLEHPEVSVLVIWSIFGLIFYLIPYYGAKLFLIMASFLISDYVPLLLTRGGHGIFQFGSSTKTLYKGHAFLGFVFSIILTSIVIEVMLVLAVEITTSSFQDFSVCFIVGFFLSVLAYFDMNKRFYQR